MSDKQFPVGAAVLIGGDLCFITKVGRYAGADGCWASLATSGGYPHFAQWHIVKPAIVGETVCPKPVLECHCGLKHVSAARLMTLPRAQMEARS